MIWCSHMKKFWHKLHLWVSIPFGLVIAIICFTGALLVFEDEVTYLCAGDVTSVEPAGEVMSIDDIVAVVEPTLADGAEVTGVVVSSSQDKAYELTLSKPRKASVYVNQYTGEILGPKERLPFFAVVFRLHRWLLDTNPDDGAIFWGRIIVGTSTLLFVVILLTGVVIWWPRNRKMLKNRLQIAVKKGKNRFWYDLHVAGGIYTVLFLLVMALTGLTWSFEWYRDGLYDLFGAEETNKSRVSAVDKADVTEAAPDGAVVAVITGDEAAEPECIGDCRNCKLDVCIYEKPAEENTDVVSDATYWAADAVSGATTKVDKAPLADDVDVSDFANIDAASGATTVDASSGATTVDASSGATTVDAASGATTVDVASGATAVLDSEVPAGAWQAAYRAVLARVPDFSQMTVSDGVVSVGKGGFGNQRASDKYIYNKETGEIVSVELYEDSEGKSVLGGWVYSLHVGSWGGVVTRILAFLAALLGATLPLTGYYLWIRRLYLKKKK